MDRPGNAAPSVAEQLFKRAPAPAPAAPERPAAPSELQSIFARLAQAGLPRR